MSDGEKARGAGDVNMKLVVMVAVLAPCLAQGQDFEFPIVRPPVNAGIQAGEPITAQGMLNRLGILMDALDALAARLVDAEVELDADCPTLRAADGSVRRYRRLPNRPGEQVVCRVDGPDPDRGDEMVRVGDFWIDRYELVVVQRVPVAGGSPAWGRGACDTGGNPEVTVLRTGEQVTGAGLAADGSWSPDADGLPPVMACSADLAVDPTVGLTWYQANQACTLVGKHLCTSAEWLAAAVGTPENGGIDGDGNPPGVVACNTRSDGRRHVGALAADADQGAAGESLAGACVSRYGALEMLGNVDEWVADRWLSEGLVHGGHYLAPVSLTSYQTRELDSTASGARCCASGH